MKTAPGHNAERAHRQQRDTETTAGCALCDLLHRTENMPTIHIQNKRKNWEIPSKGQSTEGHLDTGPRSLRESAFCEVSPKQKRGRMEDLETKMHCGRLRLGKSAAGVLAQPTEMRDKRCLLQFPGQCSPHSQSSAE